MLYKAFVWLIHLFKTNTPDILPKIKYPAGLTYLIQLKSCCNQPATCFSMVSLCLPSYVFFHASAESTYYSDQHSGSIISVFHAH